MVRLSGRRKCSLTCLHTIGLQCGTLEEDGPGGNLTERSLQDAQRLFLMSDVVQPITTDPFLTQDNVRFSKLVVDIVQGHSALYHVMYIGTGDKGRFIPQ